MLASGNFPQLRMRRLRNNSKLQDLIRETNLSINDLVLPLFIREGKGDKKLIASMPGHFQLTIDDLPAEIIEIQKLGILGVILFGIPAQKDATGSFGSHANGIVQTAIKKIKEIAPDLLIISDICLCEYTSHGHCGVIKNDNNPDVDNDATLSLLVQQAISHVQAGADIVAPSGMMDGMVQSIRKGLDQAGFNSIPILSYAIKYCSALYGPFRDAAEGAPQFGNRRTYQMDPGNAKEALREAGLDLQEGADMLMVKPAQAYLDVIYQIKQRYEGVPLGAYQVSGEFAMIKAAAEKGWLNEQQVTLEILTSIKRAGADFIITYFSKDVARWLRS